MLSFFSSEIESVVEVFDGWTGETANTALVWERTCFLHLLGHMQCTQCRNWTLKRPKNIETTKGRGEDLTKFGNRLKAKSIKSVFFLETAKNLNA